MTQDQKDLLDMYRRVHKHVKITTIAVSGTRPGLIAAIDKLKTEVIDKIDAAEAKQQQILKGFSDNKKSKRKDFDVLLFHHVSGTFAWAAMTENATLKGQMDYTETDIIHITDESVVNTANNIIGLIEPHIAVAGLNDMGVDAVTLQDLKDARDAYKAVESEPMEMIKMRTAYTKQIRTLVKRGRTILETMADKAADTLKASKKEWWTGYRMERRKIPTGHRHTTIEGTLFAKESLESDKLVGFYGGSVVATHEDGTVYTKNVDETGFYKLQKVKAGIIVSIKFMAKGRKTLELGAFKLSKGHVVRRNVYLAEEGNTEESGVVES